MNRGNRATVHSNARVISYIVNNTNQVHLYNIKKTRKKKVENPSHMEEKGDDKSCKMCNSQTETVHDQSR